MGDDGVEDEIRRCAAIGDVATFRPAGAGGTAGASGPLAPYEDEDAWRDRTVDGVWLARFLTDPGSEIHGRGVAIVGARIVGGVDLDGAQLRGALKLIDCHLGDHPVVLVEATARSVALTGSVCGGVRADGLQTLGAVLLDGGFVANGVVELRGTTVGGSVVCRNGTFTDPDGLALDIGRARVTGHVSLREGFASTGTVRLPGCSIGGNLQCGGGTLVAPGGVALDADRVEVAGDVYFTDGFTSEGTVSLRGATIAGSLTCREATFAAPSATDFAGHQVSVGRSVFLSSGFRAMGRVNLMLSTIGGDLDCTDGRFSNPGDHALIVPHAHIARSVWLNGDFICEGAVALVGSKIGNDLELDGGTLDARTGIALRAERVEVGGAVTFRQGFTATGGVVLSGARIGGRLDCSGGHFRHPEGVALEVEATEIGGEVVLRDGFTAEGDVSFVRSCAGALVDDEASWPERIDLDDFRYERLDSTARSWRARARWLQRQPAPSPQAYVHLAAVYRSTGDDHDARKILVERHNAPLHPPPHWSREPTAQRAWRWLLRYTIGHGYEPWRILTLTVPLVAGMTLWYSIAADHNLLVPTTSNIPASASDCDGTYTCVQPLVYALDTLVPLVGFEQRSQWHPNQSHHDDNPLLDGRWLAAAT
ncbi:MAG TPA: hypothetical protein VK964_07015 [Nocardioidaceae bacterium]|nr:hypothetical protein [Nocardioidaceae bacterium]